MKHLFLLITFLMLWNVSMAQGDFYDQSGKIFSVVVVVFILIIGIGAFLFYLDKRITKLEKNLEDEYSKP